MSSPFMTLFHQCLESQKLSQVETVSENFPTDLIKENESLEHITKMEFREDGSRKAIK